MASSQSLLVYVLDHPESHESIQVRVRAASEHLGRVHRDDLELSAAGDGRSGLLSWSASTDQVQWRSCVSRAEGAVAWLHLPSVAGGPESGVDEWNLANQVLGGVVPPESIGAPYAVARWRNGDVDLVNDVLGLVRLFHYRFPGGEVWASRQGLAHVFMGVEPVANDFAWNGMAVLGWASNGATQLGYGRQLPGATRVSVRNGTVRARDGFGSWLAEARGSDAPTVDETLLDMQQYMSTVRRWPEKATADLSGGKDSRLVAAVAIKSRAVATVRTLLTDYGEVETARELITLLNDEWAVEHVVTPRSDPARPGGSAIERISSQHIAWEGRFLAPTGYRNSKFGGFAPTRRPVLNGLGGEVMAGGNLLGTWTDRLIGGSLDVAEARFRATAGVALGVREDAKSAVAQALSTYVARARELRLTTAACVTDLVYHLDKMPNWSITFGTRGAVTPLFASTVLRYAAHRIGAPLAAGDSHRRLLNGLFPAWANVPFYKPSAARRAENFMWQNGDWPEVAQLLGDSSYGDTPFETNAVHEAVRRAGDGEAGKREEVFLQRVLWQVTFAAYVDRVRREAESVAHLLPATRSS